MKLLGSSLLLLLGLACAAPVRDVPASETPSALTYERIRNAEAEPHNWLTYSGQYSSQRYSRLDRIQKANVRGLAVHWVYQLHTLTEVEASPLVVDGVMYLTRSPSDVIALDARTGRPYWTYEHPTPERISICCGKQNRGVAVLGERVYVGTLDARLVALDAKTGFVLWNVEVADPKQGYSITAAPLIVKDKVITGVAGGEFGIRAFLDAYDAATGKRAWRFYTIPGEGEPGNETWEGESWKTGGSPTWMTGSYDPDLDLLYWGTGNPGPDWNGDAREGDNLYSDSVLALDPATGALRWHFQFTPHDVHDWDACQIPVLFDAPFRGAPRKLMGWANRNGFYYLLDRATGEFLLAREFAKQTWAERIDEKGRPVRVPGTAPTEDGTLVYPSVNGAANWWSPSFSPRTGLFYASAYDGAETYYKGEEEYRPGEMYVGSAPERDVPLDKYVSAIRAWDPTTGERKWEFRVKPKSTSGVLSTAGDLVFAGSVDGYFYALDATTGKELWSMSLGASVKAAPITFEVGEEQYVTIAAGDAVFTLSLR